MLADRAASHTGEVEEPNLLMDDLPYENLQGLPRKRARNDPSYDSAYDSDLSMANYSIAKDGSCDFGTFVACHGSA